MHKMYPVPKVLSGVANDVWVKANADSKTGSK